MTKYREIIRLAQPELKLSQQKIAFSCGVSKKTVNKVLKAAREKNVSWPLPASYTDAFLEGLLFPGKREQDDAFKRCMPNYVIILGYFEPPVRVFGATVPEKGSHEFRCSRATFVPCL